MANSQFLPASESSLTDLETEPSSESGIPQATHSELSALSVVPETPHANSPHSFPYPDPIPQSRPWMPLTQPRRVVPQATSHIGTPSAVGAIQKSNVLSRFVTPAPIKGSSFVPRDLAKISWITVGVSAHSLQIQRSSIKKPGDHADQAESDFDEKDAQLVLEAARARRAVCRLEQELAEARCAESMTLVKLYKYRAEDARKQHDYAEFDLGLARDLVTSNPNASDLSIVRRPNAKRLRLSSPGENLHSGKYPHLSSYVIRLLRVLWIIMM
ncbi:hypothetical protein L210DRAFT_3511522 [Boletus edulis BED1]|uniref:Uncharacterized protein n=1 Tax=Boletus edulis BED1 TaxID=1328754 RepID=A0AAD4G5L0_BOLED|nr:hypothetical protein L210DRAFT_3511522 [Boletus edulis BED1]